MSCNTNAGLVSLGRLDRYPCLCHVRFCLNSVRTQFLRHFGALTVSSVHRMGTDNSSLSVALHLFNPLQYPRYSKVASALSVHRPFDRLSHTAVPSSSYRTSDQGIPHVVKDSKGTESAPEAQQKRATR